MSLLILFNQPAAAGVNGVGACTAPVCAVAGTGTVSGGFVTLGGGRHRKVKKTKPAAQPMLPPISAVGDCVLPAFACQGDSFVRYVESDDEELAIIAAA